MNDRVNRAKLHLPGGHIPACGTKAYGVCDPGGRTHAVGLRSALEVKWTEIGQRFLMKAGRCLLVAFAVFRCRLRSRRLRNMLLETINQLSTRR